MNRNDELAAMLRELDRPVPGLEGTLERAYKRRRKQAGKWLLRPAAALAGCFAAFVLLVNYCVPVAYACSRIPVLRELAEAVTFSRSLTDAVENEYVQPLGLVQTEDGITAEIAYLIVDQKQVNIFYRLTSQDHARLNADPDIRCEEENVGFCVVNNSFAQENGELLSVTVDFAEDNVPQRLHCVLRVYAGGTGSGEAPAPAEESVLRDWELPAGPNYLTEFDFLLEFDPQFTATGKIFPVDQTVVLDGQAITVTEIQVYPSHMRVELEESPDNTAWIKDLDFYIETDWGMKFETGSGITATGSADSPSMLSYRADSPYFYEAAHLKLVITGAKWLRKDMERTYLNLVTGEHGPLPEGTEFDRAERSGSGWTVIFRNKWDEDTPMYQSIGHLFYDAQGRSCEISRWSNRFGEKDENGNWTYFYEEFPLRNYPYDEVWLSPLFSHLWTADTPIEIPVR